MDLQPSESVEEKPLQDDDMLSSSSDSSLDDYLKKKQPMPRMTDQQRSSELPPKDSDSDGVETPTPFGGRRKKGLLCSEAEIQRAQ